MSKNKKKIVFLTGTRADFGKLKSLIDITNQSEDYDVHIFVTGMHLNPKLGYTINEVYKNNYTNVFAFPNYLEDTSMDKKLAKTIEGFATFVHELKPDLIVVHGDRVEALAAATVGALNNILVAHIEGGELSGTVDELIRHAVTKMSHIHFAANQEAKKRLLQMGELESSIYVIGSPDLDIMSSNKLESFEFIKKYYELPFEKYAILMFHPVTTELDKLEEHSNQLVSAVKESNESFILIYPNDDHGSEIILKAYDKLKDQKNIRAFPSLRFEYFLVLLKNAKYIIGNSSAGIREAPFYGIPTVNIGTRQNNRTLDKEIINCGNSTPEILSSIQKAKKITISTKADFGNGNSDQHFLETLNSDNFWETKHQKSFQDIH